jgi:hypothetical protein
MPYINKTDPANPQQYSRTMKEAARLVLHLEMVTIYFVTRPLCPHLSNAQISPTVSNTELLTCQQNH